MMKKLNFTVLSLCMGMLFSATAQGPRFQEASPVDLTFESPGSALLFTAQAGTLAQGSGTLEFTFQPGAILSSPSLQGSRNQIYNPPLETWNTFFVVMENRSTASELRLSFITKEDPTYDLAKSKVFTLTPQSPKQAYYLNLSDLPQAKGQLLGFRLEPLGGTGTLSIDRISFEEEFQIEPFAGKITQCRAKGQHFSIQGTLEPQYLETYSRLCLYETAMRNPTDEPSQLTKLYEGPLCTPFEIKNLPLARGTNGMTHLSSQLLAVVENDAGQWLKVAPRFYIENWRDFEKNPYAFSLPRLSVNVCDFGARGDGFSDDTQSIQNALDSVSAQGGGRVVLPGDPSDPYGRRYTVTHLRLRSQVELHLEAGALLWQSQNPNEYPYTPTYGHDVVIPNVPWTHCMHVSNLPLLYGQSIENVKITGPGKIRSHAPYCLYEGYEHYARNCEERIHVVPLAFWNCRNIEVSDVEIIRSNNYHTAFYSCENVFLGNLKMHEVKCVSGDGMGLGMGTHNVKIVRVFLESNDDGVVLWSSYRDPRGRLWWWSEPQQDNSIHDICVCHSYINSGGGKAIAIVPWGTHNPRQEFQEIRDVTVYDNVLQGGYSVGTWFDNPFHGREPFDNAELDDYSPVKCFHIYHNEYRSPCDLICIQATSFITDCGLHSASQFQNADFQLGTCYWTVQGQAGVQNAHGYVQKGGSLSQGLWLTPGHYRLEAWAQGKGRLWIKNAQGKRLQHASFNHRSWSAVEIEFEVKEESTFFLGVTGSQASLQTLTLNPQSGSAGVTVEK